MKKWILLLSCVSITTLATVLSVGTAFADVEELTLEELVTRADTIVRGSVVGLQSHWDEDHALIYTSVTISVRGHLKPGKPGDHITVEVPGGVVGDLGMTMSHAPTFEADQDVILFLQGQEIVGLSQGKFTIVDDMVLERGVPVNQFIGQVHAVLKGRGVPVNQFIGQVHATLKGRGIPIKPGRAKGLTQPVRRFHEALLDPAGGGFGVGARSDGARPDASEHPESATTLGGWDTIMTEDFEGDFPGTAWTLYWNANSSADGWGYTWDNDPYTYHNGSGSGWCAGGQYKSNPDMSAPGPYPNDVRGWLVYGPFDLSDATDAELLFYHWTDTEPDDDYLFVGASINGSNFYGDIYSGNWASSCGGWCSVNLDLTNLYVLGNLCGESQVWIAFKFHSDSIITDEGSYLDDITLHMQTGGAMPHIDSISPDHGPAHADELGSSGCAADSTRVTINGSSFGATQGSSYVRFWRKGSTYYNACVESWSDTQIVARVPGRVSSGDVAVVTSLGTSNGVYFTVTYSYGGGKWPSGSYPQPMSEVYRVNASGGPTGALSAIQAGATTWNNVGCADFLFRYGGTSSKTSIRYEGENTILWDDLASGVLGVNYSWWYTSDPHTIIEFDIAFNTDYAWGTDCVGGYYDVQSIATHELGHSLQLLDLYGTADTAKMMYGVGSAGACKRNLHADDQASICYIYPYAGPGTPSNPSPPDGATDVSLNTDLSWTGGDPGDTVTYDVYFEANDSTPEDLICNDVSTPVCDPGTLLHNTHYYWYVVATDSHGASTTGSTWDFTTTVGGDPFEPDDTWDQASWIDDGSPQAHSIVPVGDADWLKFSLDAECEVVLETSGPSGDTSMWLYDSDLKELEHNSDGGSGLFSRIDRLCGTDALPAGTYYVKVDEYGNNHEIPTYNIAFTVVQSCGATLLAPTGLHLAAASDAHIDLAWTDNSDESDFHMERSPNGSTGWTEIGTVGLDVTSYSDSGLNPATTYYYRVRAHRHSDNQYSGYSNVASGTTLGIVEPPPTVNSPPYAPSNPSPADGATDQNLNLDLSWSGGDPDGHAVTYDVFLTANGSSSDAPVCDDVTDTSCDPGPLSYDTHYSWWVIARDEHGATSTGPVWHFTTPANGMIETGSYYYPRDGLVVLGYWFP